MISLVLIKFLDFLVEAFYASIWSAVNWVFHWLLNSMNQWLLRRGISVHPSKLAEILYWVFQVLFGLSTFTVIVLHAVKDLKDLISGQHSGFAEVGMKFVDLAKQAGALAVWSACLIGWILLNLIVDKILDGFSGNEASMVTPWRFAAEVVWAAVTLCVFGKPMFDETTKVYRRLF